MCNGGDIWCQALQDFDTQLDEWSAFQLRDIILGGGWNVVADSADPLFARTPALGEFAARRRMQEPRGRREPTHTWAHPTNGGEHRHRLDLFLILTEAWRGRRLHTGRSDHHAVVAIRDGRQAKSWRPRADTRSWVARARGWTPRTIGERDIAQRALSLDLAGARSCSELQVALTAAPRTIPEPKSSGTDDVHDDLAELAARQEAKRRRLRDAASGETCSQAPHARGGGAGEEGWRVALRGGAGDVGGAALLACWESRAAADRLDGVERTPMPDHEGLAASQAARTCAAAGMDGVPQGLVAPRSKDARFFDNWRPIWLSLSGASG